MQNLNLQNDVTGVFLGAVYIKLVADDIKIYSRKVTTTLPL